MVVIVVFIRESREFRRKHLAAPATVGLGVPVPSARNSHVVDERSEAAMSHPCLERTTSHLFRQLTKFDELCAGFRVAFGSMAGRANAGTVGRSQRDASFVFVDGADQQAADQSQTAKDDGRDNSHIGIAKCRDRDVLSRGPA